MEQAPAKSNEAAKAAGEKYIAGLEADQQNLLRDYLERHEFAYTWSRTDKRTRGVLGTPDFTITALRLAIEFKQPGGKLSPNQEIWRERHCEKGGSYAIVTSFEAALNIIEDTCPD